jgi:hypothetical protein
MTATPHILAGAAIGRGLRRPWLAWPAAFGSHFLLDFTPHLDDHALFGVQGGGVTPAEAASGILNFALGWVLVGWLVRRRPDRRIVLGGAFFAIVIDIIDHIPRLNHWFASSAGTAWLSDFHHGCQHNVTPAQWPLGIGTQLALVGLAVWFLLRTGQGRRDGPAGRRTGMCKPYAEDG